MELFQTKDRREIWVLSSDYMVSRSCERSSYKALEACQKAQISPVEECTSLVLSKAYDSLRWLCDLIKTRSAWYGHVFLIWKSEERISDQWAFKNVQIIRQKRRSKTNVNGETSPRPLFQLTGDRPNRRVLLQDYNYHRCDQHHINSTSCHPHASLLLLLRQEKAESHIVRVTAAVK